MKPETKASTAPSKTGSKTLQEALSRHRKAPPDDPIFSLGYVFGVSQAPTAEPDDDEDTE